MDGFTESEKSEFGFVKSNTAEVNGAVTTARDKLVVYTADSALAVQPSQLLPGTLAHTFCLLQYSVNILHLLLKPVRRTEGASYIRQGGHHVEHWPTFLVLLFFLV